MTTVGHFADHKLISHKRPDEPVQLTIAVLAGALAGGAGIEKEALTKLTLASLDIPGDTGATLSLFAVRAEAFVAESETMGAMLANHARNCACPRHARAPVQGVGYP